MPMRPHPYQDRTENAGNRSHEEASTDTDPERHLARLPDLRTQCGCTVKDAYRPSVHPWPARAGRCTKGQQSAVPTGGKRKCEDLFITALLYLNSPGQLSHRVRRDHSCAVGESSRSGAAEARNTERECQLQRMTRRRMKKNTATVLQAAGADLTPHGVHTPFATITALLGQKAPSCRSLR